MDMLSPRQSLFEDLVDEAQPVADHDETDTRRPGREPVHSIETLLDGRSAWEAVLEDARPFVRR